jgi:hypothetical protein
MNGMFSQTGVFGFIPRWTARRSLEEARLSDLSWLRRVPQVEYAYPTKETLLLGPDRQPPRKNPPRHARVGRDQDRRRPRDRIYSLSRHAGGDESEERKIGISTLSRSVRSKVLWQKTSSNCSLLVTMIVSVAAISGLLFLSFSSPCGAQEAWVVDSLDWQKLKATGIETASSRSETSVNFMDIGDLSTYSLYLVQETVGSIAGAAGGDSGSFRYTGPAILFEQANPGGALQVAVGG